MLESFKKVNKVNVNEILTLTLAGIILIMVMMFSGCRDDFPDDSEKSIRPLPVSAKILFLSNKDTESRAKEIYAMDDNGGNITRITYSNYHHRLVGIDKTKKYIVATRIVEDTDYPPGLGDEDRKSLWILNLETATEKRLTHPDNNAEGDNFSPDGEWIVFYMVVEGENQADIYKIKKDGSELTRLTHTVDATESDPAWSNDGRYIAFVSYSSMIKRFVLKIMDVDGSNVKTVYDCNDTLSTPYFKPGVYDPSWSPDDEWIVFEKAVHYNGENGNAGIWHIFKIHPDGTGLIDLSKNGGHTDMAEYYPSFSEDGEKIVFSARYGSSAPDDVKIDIFTMDKDGKNLKKLTTENSINDFGIWIK